MVSNNHTELACYYKACRLTNRTFPLAPVVLTEKSVLYNNALYFFLHNLIKLRANLFSAIPA